jgi:tetratricopeptide (TPR) repeat protein
VVDLQGYSPDGHVEARQVFAPLLRQLGVAGEQIPAETGEQAAVYDQTLVTLAEQGRRVLLVLDNISSAAQVRGLLPAGGSHRVVVTTRDTLDLPGAWRLPLDVLDVDDAVALLAHQSGDDRLSRDAAIPLAQACGRLPLALRIAAGLLTDDPDLTATELTAELAESPVDAFTYGESEVAAVFDLSWDRLLTRDPIAARVLRLLVLDPGPDLSTDAAAALTDLPAAQVRTRLRVLHHAHLLERVAGRWRLHDLVRRYIRDRATDYLHTDDPETATTRLLDRYTDTTRAADNHLRALPGHPVPSRFTDRDAALAWLDVERANLMAAVALAAATHRHAHTTRLAGALDNFLHWRRHLADRVAIAQHALAAATHLDIPTTLADAWTYLGLALLEVRRFDEAITAHETARDIFRETGDRHGEGMAWNNLGLALQNVGRFDEAITAHRADLQICRETGDRHGEGTAWNNLGVALRNVRRFDEAITAHETARDIFRETADRHREGMAWNNLGLALQNLGRFDEAITAHRADLQICRETGDRHGEGMAWNNLGVALRNVRRFDEAITAHETARDIYRETADRHREGMAWDNLGLALQEAGRFNEARQCWSEAAEAYIEAGDSESADAARQALETITSPDTEQ